MAKRNTKEIILFESLKLFADRGYDGVTVRDIANEVGIMQSSLYKHYTSKQDIFDTLVAKMHQQFSEASAGFHLPEGDFEKMAQEYATSGNNVLKEISKRIFQFYLHDEHASQFRKMLSIEKYKNPEIGKLYREVYFDTVLAYQAKLFSEMIKQGYMRQVDPNIIAIHFYAPIFLLLNEYDVIPEREAEAIAQLENHIDQFDAIYRKDEQL